MNELAAGTVVRTVTEFTAGLERWFERQPAFKGAAISGEISGLKEINGGHLVFVLKDRGAVLNCIVWRSKIGILQGIKNGMAVVAVGDVRLRNEQSSYQMLVDAVHLTGIGELYARLEALKVQFRNEGLFDPARKRAIPQFVGAVALISAPGSKASEDFLETMRSQVPFVRVTFLGTRVQGAGAEIDIREAFDRADKLDVDAIVVTRGGGSYEDLFTFNEEVVVRAIARSRHPVITAIGHQEDHHLADDVADATYGTPSKAAEAIAAVWVATRARVARAKRDLSRAVELAIGRSGQRLALSRQHLDGAARTRTGAAERAFAQLERRLTSQNPAGRVAKRAERLASLRPRLAPAWGQYLQRRVYALGVAQTRLAGLDPELPLQRGYALILRGDALVRGAQDVAVGDAIRARLGHGTLDARVEALHDD